MNICVATQQTSVQDRLNQHTVAQNQIVEEHVRIPAFQLCLLLLKADVGRLSSCLFDNEIRSDKMAVTTDLKRVHL